MRTNIDADMVDMVVLIPAHIIKTAGSSVELNSILENAEGKKRHARTPGVAESTNFRLHGSLVLWRRCVVSLYSSQAVNLVPSSINMVRHIRSRDKIHTTSRATKMAISGVSEPRVAIFSVRPTGNSDTPCR
jgi:hypothetical protein